MSRIRHAGGNITVTTKGKETTYAKGNIELHSNKKVNIKGEEKGVSLGKPQSYKPKTDLLVTKVEGPYDETNNLVKIVKMGVYYTYKASLNREPKPEEIKMLRWATKNDDAKINELLGVSANNGLKDKKIIIGVAINNYAEKARIYAYLKKPLQDKSIEVKLEPLQNIIVIGTQKHRGDTSFNPLTWRDVGAGSKLMFAHQALRRMRLNRDIRFAVFMCEDGYESSHLKAVKDSVEKLYGGKFHQIDSAQKIINYINTGEKNNSSTITDERKVNPVKQLFFYSHGLVGTIALGMSIMNDNSNYAFGKEAVAKLNKEAFTSESHIYSFACRTGLGNSDVDKSIYKQKIKSSNTMGGNSMGIPMSSDQFETVQMPLLSAQSIAQKLSNQTGAITYAYLRRSDYEDTLFTKDELAFSDYMKKREGKTVELSPERYGDKYKYLLDKKYKLTDLEEKRIDEWKEIESNYKKIDDAWFDQDGARHNVKAAKTPVGVPAEMQTFKPLKK